MAHDVLFSFSCALAEQSILRHVLHLNGSPSKSETEGRLLTLRYVASVTAITTPLARIYSRKMLLYWMNRRNHTLQFNCHPSQRSNCIGVTSKRNLSSSEPHLHLSKFTHHNFQYEISPWLFELDSLSEIRNNAPFASTNKSLLLPLPDNVIGGIMRQIRTTNIAISAINLAITFNFIRRPPPSHH